MTEVSTPRSSDRKKHRNFKGLKMASFPPAASIQGCESLDMSENPITSFRTLETIPTLTHLNIRNTLIESFQFVQPQPKLTHIVVADTPLARYSTIVVMCICTFGEQLMQVNGRPISKDDKKRAGKLHRQLFCYLNNGWLLTGLDPIRCYHFQTRQRRVFQRNGQIPSIPLLVEKPVQVKPKPKLKTRLMRTTKRLVDGQNEMNKTTPSAQQINATKEIAETTDSLQSPSGCHQEEALEQGKAKGVLSEPALITSACAQADAAPIPEDTQTKEPTMEAEQYSDNVSEPDEKGHHAFIISSDDELNFSDEQAFASYYSDDDYDENMDPNIGNGNPGSARGESKLMQLIRGSQPYRTYEEDTLEDTIKMLTPNFDPFAGDSSSMSLSACSSCADIRFDSDYFERQNQMLADLDVSSDISEVQDSTEPNRYRRRLSTRQRRLSALKYHRRRCQRKSLAGALTQSDDYCTLSASPRQSLLVPVA